ncbi:MAG: leucine-rich repeat protein [Prevotella sp.]|nr:leucine-rich repeat protein [Prevotella sp.]
MKTISDFSAHSAKGLGGANGSADVLVRIVAGLTPAFCWAAMMLLMMMLTATTAWATITGSGTSADPYVINTVNDWNTAATTQQYYDNGSNYVYIKLGADLNFTNKTFNIFGLSASGLATARMIRFDGQEHTISGVTISKSGSAEIAALFGGLSAGGSISHLTVASSSFQAYKYVAGIVAYNGGTVSDCHVASTVTLKVGYSHCGGIVASNYTPNSSTGGTVTGCTVGACLQLPSRTMNKTAFGGIVGDQNSAGTISNCLFYGTVTVYDGTTTLFGCITDYYYGTITGNCYCPIGTYLAFGEGSDRDGAAAVSMVSGIPDGATVSSAATYTYGGNTYCAQNAATTITAGTNKAFSTFTVTGATCSLAGDKKSATVNLGTNDVTITATLQTIGGSCGDNATWTLAQDDSGNYTRLTISGTGAMDDCEYKTVSNLWRTAADWGYDLTSVTISDGITRIGEFAFIGCQSLATVTIGSGVTEIAQGAINHCDEMTQITLPAVTSVGEVAFENCAKLERIDFGHNNAVTLATSNAFNAKKLQYIVFPSPAGAVANTATSGNWSGYASKLRVAFGNQLFQATNEGGTPAYKIATEQDLRNLAAVINANTNLSTAITGSDMTFRQTDDITLSQTFTPIGAEGTYGKWFSGTYDGGDKTISGLTVNTSSQYAGLFGFVNKGTVKNVRLISPNVTNNYNSSQWNAYAGALAGRTQNSNVENCFVYNPNVSAPNTSLKYVGAIVGYLEISLTNTHFYSNADYAIAGYYDIGSLTNSGRARMVTLGSGVTGVSPDATAAENGFVYDSKSYYREGVTLTLASNPRAGYAPVFAANSTTFSGNTYTVSDGDVTFTFVENTPITYNITYNTNGGTMPDGYATTYNIESVNITLPTPTRKGYTFAGWYANEGLTDPAVTSITHGSTGDKQFWAKWTANTYTVHFDGNGNTDDGTMTGQSFTYDEAQNLKANTYTRAFTVTYNYNGATGGNSEGSATATATFNGWATSADGQKVYDDNQSVSNLTDANGATVTLYAKWTDASITLPTPTLTGYIFGGWYADSEWNTRLGYAGASYTPSTDITLYAKWTQFDWATESTGTETDPYVIYNNEQLDLLAQRVNDATGDDGAATGYKGKYFVLGADIAYSHAEQEGGEYESNYTAIGNGNTFRGHFDGQGHTVSGIRIYKAGNNGSDVDQGLFGKSSGNIRGITLADARITGYNRTGGIVGENYGTVSNCHVAATVTIHDIQSDTWYHGGIVGINNGTVSDCTSAATLTKPDNTNGTGYGGIAGFNDGTLRHNLAIGAVVPSTRYNTYGAICGANNGGNLENNYYHDCTVAGVENATGVGCGKADVTVNNGAVPAYVLTIGDGVDFLTAMADNLGFRYDSDGDGKAENYCPEGAKFTLNKAGYNDAEYTVTQTADGTEITGTAIIDNVLTMPGYDITVSFSGEPIDWANDGHSGTETDPYIIYNKAQLDKLAQRVNSGEGDAATGYSGKYFKLGADIAYSHKTDNEAGAATESNYTAIGNSGKLFCGHFDGQGHTVSGIRIYSDADSNQGLFGQTGTGANVHHVHLTDARIKGYENVGGIVGLKSGGTVSNCTVTETAITATAYYGTICGKNSNGTLTNNYYRHSTVNGNAYGVGCQGADVIGALPAYALTLGEGVNILTAMADDLGFSYDSDGDGQAENYWREGAQLTLADLPTEVPEGYVISYTVTQTTDGTDITGNALNGTTLTVPYADVTVTMTLTAIPWSGTGTENDPWVIIYPSQLDLLAQRVNSGTGDDDAATGYKGKYFVLGADIAYRHAEQEGGEYESNYTAIGNGNTFCGHFDGRGHTVSGIRIYMGSGCQGLFGQSGGNIRGITLADARISGYINYDPSLGGIVGANSGTVSDCHVAATVTIRAYLNHNYSYKLGGIVGENKGTVSDCTSAATLTTNESSSAYHGGIAGYNYSGTLSHNLAIGAVVPAADNSHGAICGISDGGTLENNYYHACTVAGTENATGVGCGKTDVTDNNGAVPAYVLTIGDGVSFLTAMADNLGFRYDSDGDGKAENYCLEGAKFTLNKAGYNDAEYTVTQTADGTEITGTAIIDNVLTMPGFDITVNFSGEPIDWANDGHSGTETDPYIIYNKAQLDKLAQRVNGTHGETANDYKNKYFKLGADIIYDTEGIGATGSNYTAIGNSGNPFCGHFDGQGHSVSGIRIYSNADSYQGLFGQTGTGACIQGIILTDARITGYANTGGIAGSNGGTLSHNRVIGAVVAATTDNTPGAICGENGGTLENNYYHDCTVAGVENATGKGCNNDDVDDNNGAMPAFLVTPGEGITIQTPMADDLGFSYDSDGDGQDENYWRKGAQLILANQFANVPEGYTSSTITVTKTANGIDITSNALNGTTLTVPTADVTVTVTLTPIPWSGTGTRDDPWVISYPSQLDLLAQRVNSATGDYEDYGNRGKYYYKYKGKYFVLGADITYNHDDDANDAVYASNYTAIGCDFGNQVCFFSGHFDGRGHTVSGIRIYKGAYLASINQGLFGLSGGNIRGITLADARITGYDNTGGIVGNNKGTVSDCHIAADVYIHAAQSGANYHGGIVGENGGTIDQCTSAATLTIADADNSYCYGGIVGENGGTLRHNLAIGATVPAAADNTYGAICGEKGGTLENNYYHACTVAGTENATSVGCNKADVTDGAEPGIILYDHSSRTDINSSILTKVGNVAVPRVALAGRTLYQDGDWNTLCLPFDVALAGSPLEGATVMELDNREGSGTGFDATTGILTLNFVDISPSGEQVGLMTAGRPYIVKWPSSIARTISSTDDWHDFAAAVAGGNTYEGKVVTLDDDINVSEMVGTSEHKFKGTFDGQGHTLTLNDLSASGEACAPFRYVEGATIANLHTTGSVIADKNEASKFRSGLVGQSDGNTTILNSWSSVTISSGISGDGTHGGFIGVSSSGDATISNCRFDGSFSGSSTKCWGGFVGWSNSATSIRNSVFAPEGITIDQSGSTTFSRNKVKTTNCYYSVALNDFTNGATAIGTTSADDLAADLGSGWQVKDGKAVPVITSIGITDPVFSTVTIDDTNRDVTFTGGSFKGTYQTIAFDKEDQSILFLGAKNTLYYPQKGATINAFRAYFDLGGAHARQFVLNFGEDGEAQGIKEIDDLPIYDLRFEAGAWYTLDGVKLDGKPTKKGLYIHGGRKVVVK